ncbi:hypothetical protein BC827DRAFT_1162190 [Russula dissimulans]|jgi:hypothetical protein|nr:hypothetical protein BC827DRAFT_1162190 [Russula dissimulans]
MPKQSSSSNSKATSSSSSGTKSDYQYYKAYGGWNGFMHNQGLKPWDAGDPQEGKAIVAEFRKNDEAEAKNSKK